DLTARSVTASGHVNDEPPRRAWFSEIDSYTAGASDRNPMFVLVAGNDDLRPACSDGTAGLAPRPPQPSYRVGLLTAPARLAGALSDASGGPDHARRKVPRPRSDFSRSGRFRSARHELPRERARFRRTPVPEAGGDRHDRPAELRERGIADAAPGVHGSGAAPRPSLSGGPDRRRDRARVL